MPSKFVWTLLLLSSLTLLSSLSSVLVVSEEAHGVACCSFHRTDPVRPQHAALTAVNTPPVSAVIIGLWDGHRDAFALCSTSLSLSLSQTARRTDRRLTERSWCRNISGFSDETRSAQPSSLPPRSSTSNPPHITLTHITFNITPIHISPLTLSLFLPYK